MICLPFLTFGGDIRARSRVIHYFDFWPTSRPLSPDKMVIAVNAVTSFTSIVVKRGPPESPMPEMSGWSLKASPIQEIHASWSVSAHALRTFDNGWLFRPSRSCDFEHGGTMTLSASLREMRDLDSLGSLLPTSVASAKSSSTLRWFWFSLFSQKSSYQKPFVRSYQAYLFRTLGKQFSFLFPLIQICFQSSCPIHSF